MFKYVSRRFVITIPLLLLISVVSFVIIQLPPGDYVDTYVQNLARSGARLDQSIVDAMKKRYALDKPLFVQYSVWIGGILTRGDFGNSFAYNRPVSDILAERVPRTMGITLGASCWHGSSRCPLASTRRSTSTPSSTTCSRSWGSSDCPSRLSCLPSCSSSSSG